MIDTKHFPLGGGLDLVTPPINMPPGRVIGAMNYECTLRGNRRIDGFERFDGRPKPSEASYWVLNFDAGTATIAEGATVTGATSGATGTTLIAMVVSTGTFGGSNAAGYLVLTNVVGTFQDNENLQVSAVTKCVADGTAAAEGASNDTDDTTWAQDAIATARAAIGTVAGSGVIRGVWVYGGNTWAIRDNALGTAGVLFKATTAGWVAQDLGRTVSFTSGDSPAPAEGAVMTGDISGATAVIKRVIVTSGDWSTGDAAGRLILASQTGTFQAETVSIPGNANLANIAGNSTAHALLPGGRYDFTNHNFYGASNLERMYFADGVNPAGEWDGTVYVPILTGMTIDKPTHIAEHRQHLFLSFLGGSLQHSSPGDPYDWSPITGAAELATGHDITGLLSAVSGVLVVFGRNKVNVLYGYSVDDWDLVALSEDSGCIEWTAQMIATPTYMDDAGIRTLNATQAYGDFRMGTISGLVEPLFTAKRAGSITAVASLRVRSKNQYRIFFSDGTGLSFCMDRKPTEAMPFDLGKRVYTICSSEDSSGNEILFFGSSDGYVYQLDAGTSFDGATIPAFFRLAFNHLGRPTQKKRWHKITVELDADPSVAIGVIADFDYASADAVPVSEIPFSITGGGGFWDEAVWDEFIWSNPVNGVAQARIDGIGANISVAVASSAIYEGPHTIQGITLHYSNRGIVR